MPSFWCLHRHELDHHKLASFCTRSHLSASLRHIITCCEGSFECDIISVVVYPQNTENFDDFHHDPSQEFLLSAFLRYPYHVFGQLEPKRGCFDAALADASRDFDLALNFSKVAGPSKLPMSRERAAVIPMRILSLHSSVPPH